MKWHWWWPFGRRERKPSPELLAVQQQLAEVKAKDPEVFRLADELRRIRERNNFAALFGGHGFRDR